MLSSAWLPTRFLPGSVTLGCLLSNRMALIFLASLLSYSMLSLDYYSRILLPGGKGKIVYPAEKTPDNWLDVRFRRSVLPRLATNLLFQARLQVFLLQTVYLILLGFASMKSRERQSLGSNSGGRKRPWYICI